MLCNISHWFCRTGKVSGYEMSQKTCLEFMVVSEPRG